MRKNKISLILPTYNEEKTIKKSILEFQKTGMVNEILVIDNNARFNVRKAIQKTKAKVIYQSAQGYGAAIQMGMEHAQGDLIVICEPDGTFVADDIFKLLSYTPEFDMVLGSRTTQALIWEGANMGLFLKWGNYFTAKLIEFLFDTSSLTDAGCTYRIIKKHALEKIKHQFRISGGDFGPEMIILAVQKHLSIIQIPVNYKQRIGVSGYTGTFSKALMLGLKMISYILAVKLNIIHYEI